MKPWPRRAPEVLLAWASLCIGLALAEDISTEGLSSTSFVDFTAVSHMESLESSEQRDLKVSEESDLVPSALQAAPGSGFPSEEIEDSKILQPQYFWEEGGDLNDSSLYPGATPDNNFPLASQKALPKGNVTETKNQWDGPALHRPADSAEPDSEAPPSGTHEEEEGLLPINQSKGAPQSSQRPKIVFPETGGQEDSLYSILLSTATSGVNVATEVAIERQEEESAPEHASSGFDLGSSMGPSLLPPSSMLSATPEGPQGISEIPFKSTSESTVAVVGEGSELAEPIATVATVKEVEATTRGEGARPSAGTGLEQASSSAGPVSIESTETSETEQANEDLLITASRGDGFQVTETVSRTGNPPSPSSSVDWTDKPAPTPSPAWNSTELPGTATAAAEKSFAPQTGDVHMAVLSTGVPWSLPQVTCKDWSNLAGKNYIILNMSDNIDCEAFRVERGPQLLALVEEAFSRYENGLQNQWWISLSKPNENDKHLLMTLAGEHGVIPTDDVLLALDDMRRSLAEIGIQNYTTTTSCQSRPSQTHSDYGKLFVVLVIIGSVCVIIIIMGLIYNCWQRRLPKMKNMSHGEELRFVENGCHDNPTLDVASDSQSEMQEKKPSVNGGGSINGPESWNVLINKRAGEEGDAFEEDTHL